MALMNAVAVTVPTPGSRQQLACVIVSGRGDELLSEFSSAGAHAEPGFGQSGQALPDPPATQLDKHHQDRRALQEFQEFQDISTAPSDPS